MKAVNLKSALFVAILTLASVGQTALAGEALLHCISIDPTLSPSFEVTVSTFDPTFEGSLLVHIEKTTDGFPGPVTVMFDREGEGRINDDGSASIRFEQGSLEVRSLSNGFLAGTMSARLHDETVSNVELSCQNVVDPQ